MEKPCDGCPWRTANQGKPHPGGWYTKKNLQRLWNQIRKGGGKQSCHPTDPSHPDHVKYGGAKEGAKTRECPGSVILVRREMRKMADEKGVIGDVKSYLATRKRGLTKTGLQFWLLSRIQFGGVPILGGEKLPEVDEDDPEISLPEFLREG